MLYKVWFWIGKNNGFLIKYLNDHYKHMKRSEAEFRKDKRVKWN